MKKAILVHGWDGSPDEAWFPWLKDKLEARGYQVEAPSMPETGEPVIEKWVPYLKNVVGQSDRGTCFVGGSIGCQTIMRYLETLPQRVKVGPVVFVAGWFTLENLEGPESEAIAKPWIETPIDLAKVRSHLTKLVCFFSDDDPWVPLEKNRAKFEQELGAKVIVQQGKGHFDELTELPEVLGELK